MNRNALVILGFIAFIVGACAGGFAIHAKLGPLAASAGAVVGCVGLAIAFLNAWKSETRA